MGDTGQSILKTALRLFSTDGYRAVSMSAIAAGLGITKGALYRHYKSKRDIFDSIIARMEKLDAQKAAEYELPLQTAAQAPAQYENICAGRIIEYARAQFTYWTEDEFAAQFRRLLTLEQYRDPQMARLYHDYLCAGPLEYTADMLAAAGIAQPEQRAIQLYAPMFLMYEIYDAAQDKSAAAAALDRYFDGLRAELAGE